MTESVVRLEDVHKAIGATRILNGITMSVGRAEVVSVIGPSGSGKSTLLRCVNALTSFDRGEITVAGHRLADPRLDKLALRRKVGIVFQQYNLFPHWTVLQNVMKAPIHVLGQKRREVEERARGLLDKVRLGHMAGRYPGELSGGQQQRVAIARSLAMQPDVMMFDEVTAALDPATVRDVLVAIEELARDGMTCILVTHEMGFARRISNRVYFMDAGVIVEHGPPQQIFGEPCDDRTRGFLEHIL